MSKKTKKQNRRLHNKKSRANQNSKAAKGTSSPRMASKRNTNVEKASSISKNNKTSSLRNTKVKKRYILTDKVKTILTVTVCVVMVLAFAIPTGLSVILNTNPSNVQNEEQQATQDSSASLTGVTRNMKEAFDETGKFDHFLIVDQKSGTRLHELYDSYVTIDDMRILAEKANEEAEEIANDASLPEEKEASEN